MRLIKFFALLLAVSSLIYYSDSFAAKTTAAKPKKAAKPPRKYPHGCRELGYEFESSLLILKPVSESEDIQTVYLVHNKAPHPVHFIAKRDPKDYTAPPFENVIRGGQWGAFAMNQAAVEFICSTPDQAQTINCGDVLELCQYTRAKFGTAINGTYWIMPSSSQKEAVRRTIHDGVLLRW